MSEEHKIKRWEEMLSRLKRGDLLTGVITRVEPFGVFVDVGEEFLGLILVPFISKKESINVQEYPEVGSVVQAVILAFSKSRRSIEHSYISLSIKDVPK